MTGRPRNLLTAWTRLFVGSLAQAGIQHAVISPGSRSTPLVCALLEHGGFELHSVLDERAAAFFALGLAKVSLVPPLLVCTSGTAGAHYYPAVIEASESALPLVVVTADRPHELVDCSAPQTIDQAELFGRFVRGYFELGNPDADEAALLGLRRKAVQGVGRARGPEPGPVHFDFRAKKPLEPLTAASAEEHELEAWVDRALTQAPRFFPAVAQASEAGLAQAAAELSAASRPLVLLGAADALTARAVEALAERWAAPLLAETAAHSPSAAPAQQLLKSFAQALPAPDCIVRFGAPLTAAALEAWLGASPARQVVVATRGYPDPGGQAALVLQGEPGAVASELARRIEPRQPGEFHAAWQRAARSARTRLTRDLADTAPFSEAVAASVVLSNLPAQSQLCLGNSMPLRLADAVRSHAWAERNGDAVRVFTQRGANGIDGAIAGAVGVARAGQRPTLALIGDVTAAHDFSSLSLAKRLEVPLCIVVLDNRGGHIFDHLPLARSAADLGGGFEFWTTPPELDFELGARSHGVEAVKASDRIELGQAVRAALGRAGATLIVVPLDAAATAAFFAGLEVPVEEVPLEDESRERTGADP